MIDIENSELLVNTTLAISELCRERDAAKARIKELEQEIARLKRDTGPQWHRLDAPSGRRFALVFDGQHYRIGQWEPRLGTWAFEGTETITVISPSEGGLHLWWRPLPRPPEGAEVSDVVYALEEEKL